MAEQTRPIFDQLGDWMSEIGTKTAAAQKKAGPSGMGKSTHPSDDVDDNTQDEQTGARYEENAKDVKKDVPGPSVDETPEGGQDQDKRQMNIGTQQAATGEDPSVEDDYKGDKDDPGTTHPMNADDQGEKYSSHSLKDLLVLNEKAANDLLASIANTGMVQTSPAKQETQKKDEGQKKAGEAQPANKSADKQSESSSVPQQTPKHGFDFGPLGGDGSEKLAADIVEQSIRDAELDADLVGAYIHNYAAGRQKQANYGEGGPTLPPEGGPPGGEIPPEVLAQLTGGAPGGPEGGSPMPPPGAEGPPGGPEGLPPGAEGLPPGAEGPPPGAEGPPPGEGGPEGAMSEEEALQELAMALEELGIPPEALAAEGAGPEGGPPMPPPGGPEGGPPMPPPDMKAAQCVKLANAVQNFKRTGKFKFQEAKTARQREARDQIKSYIRELLN